MGKIDIVKAEDGAFTSLEKFSGFDLDTFVKGESKKWTLWNCPPSTFPWSYTATETAYICGGSFSVQYEGEEPVEIVAGDLVTFQPGETTFIVHTPVRKFFYLATE